VTSRLFDRTMFLAVADEESFSEAASRLDVPVSTISRRVSRLESELGVSLLERTTRHVRLTEVGRTYAEHLRPLLTQLGDLEATIAARDSLTTGTLRVAAPAGLDRPFFGPAMAVFYEDNPGIEVLWSVSNASVHPIRDGFDVVITEQRVVDAELVARKVLTTREVCVASPSYLERRGRPKSARELAEHDALVLGTSRGPVHWPLSGGGKVSVTPMLRCDDYGLLIEGAVHGLGIALVPLLMVRAHPEPDALEVVLDGVVGVRRDIHICYARNARSRGVVSSFVRFVREYVKLVPVFQET
jgi:DNA-binding transcriptional LysR family regulator